MPSMLTSKTRLILFCEFCANTAGTKAAVRNRITRKARDGLLIFIEKILLSTKLYPQNVAVKLRAGEFFLYAVEIFNGRMPITLSSDFGRRGDEETEEKTAFVALVRPSRMKPGCSNSDRCPAEYQPYGVDAIAKQQEEAHTGQD
jgi:hypothetical protein